MNTKPKEQRLLLTGREAADTLAISQRTLFTLTKTGQLTAVRIGRGVRYATSDLEKFITSQRTHAIESTPEDRSAQRQDYDG